MQSDKCARLQHASPRALLHNSEGGAAVLAAFGIMGFVGFAALGTDAAYWYTETANTQLMADTAALAAAHAKVNKASTVGVDAAALAAAEKNGFDEAAPGSVLTVADIGAGQEGGHTEVVEVAVERELDMYLASMFMPGPIVSSANAAAGVKSEAIGTACVIAFDPTADRALEFIGTTVAHVNCGIASNSASTSSLYISGNAEVTATPIQAFGDIHIGNGATVNTDRAPLPHSDRVDDPFADRSLPVGNGACDENNVQVKPKDNITLDAASLGGSMTICGRFKVQGTVTLTSGTYYVHNGDWTVNSGAVMNGDGVTIVLTGDNWSSVGRVTINGGADVNLTAPSSGDYAGIVVYTDRRASPDVTDKFNGGSTMRMDGALYAPTRQLRFNGGNSNNSGCTRIFARIVKFTGTSDLSNDPAVCAAVALPQDDIFSHRKNVSLIE